MRMPGVEPGSQAWEACMIPLHYMRRNICRQSLILHVAISCSLRTAEQRLRSEEKDRTAPRYQRCKRKLSVRLFKSTIVLEALGVGYFMILSIGRSLLGPLKTTLPAQPKILHCSTCAFFYLPFCWRLWEWATSFNRIHD